MTEKRLWAPWRMEYVKQDDPPEDECIFCAKPKAGDDEGSYIVCRGQLAYVILNAYPYNNGHLMVSPYDHVNSLEGLDQSTIAEMMQLASRSTGVLGLTYSPEGFNIGINQGKVAGAGMEHHLHLHVVPRWAADTNFMPVLADTRVLPQHLSESYQEIKAGFETYENS